FTPTMSPENHFRKMWTDAQKDLDIQLQREREELLQPEQDLVKVFRMLATSYIKYVQIFRTLETAHDQLLHQQKRALIRQVLDGVIGRILELKKEMVDLEKSEFHYIGNILEDLKLLPVDMEIPIPRYFIKEQLEVLQQREKILDQILLFWICYTSDLLEIEPVEAMTFEEAIKVIQVAERARQGRCRAVYMKRIYLAEKRAKQPKVEIETGLSPDDAATRIQKVWRGCVQRKKTENLREEEMVFLGMSLPPHLNAMSILQMDAEQVNALQGEIQERDDEIYVKNKLREAEGLGIKETLRDQIGQCFIECRTYFLPPAAAGKTNGFCNFLPLFCSFWITAVWQNRDERWDFLQDHDPELMKEEKREEVEKEIRVQVSNNWPWTIDSLYEELVEEGLLIKAKTVNLSDYVGEYSYLGTTLRQADREPVPSLADVRQLIALYGILPLGSEIVHEKAPLVKALLLAGPAGVGKKMLVHAICTETGANLFNLSASSITGKYPGKSGLQMMLHMVLKVAKQLQPSVVWIGDTEKIFPKAASKMGPERLEKMLPKFLKALRAPDRVLLVGTTNRPFNANLKPFCKVYQKIIVIPRPDYASRFVLWKHIILQNGGVITNLLNISCLAKVSDGFTPGQFIRAVQAVLTKLRLLQMSRKPLRTDEFIGFLATQDPVYREEEEAFKVMLRAVNCKKRGHSGSAGCFT
uniref:IQ motif containing with AAA domain 1 n=1 Tax=Amazona collaria TaxID=241587 RepID=A0A8B9FVW6_9PSIT